MSSAEKTIQKMRNNPRDWRIDDLKRVADRVGIDYRQPGTSHATFSRPDFDPLSVPADKPIKPVYVRLFVELVDKIEGE